MAQEQVSGKSSSPIVLAEESWRGALPSRYTTSRWTFEGCRGEPRTLLTFNLLGLDVAAAPGVDRGRSDPSTLRLCVGPLRGFCFR